MMTKSKRMFVSTSRIRTMALTFAAGLTLLIGIPAAAQGDGAGEARIAECIRQAAGGKPWLEKTLWGLRDQEAGWIGAQVRNTNGSHDLGPLQINSGWVPKIAALVGHSQAEVRFWLTSDPCFNAGAARWLFLTALSTTGDFWQAVGVYHSPTGWRQRRYALDVARHMQRRFGREVFAVSVIPRNAGLAAPKVDAVGPAITPSIRLHGFGVVNDPLN